MTRLGFYAFTDLWDIFTYMLPEILILIFIMLNEIMLKLNGIYYQIEEDYETVNDGIQRFVQKGNTEAVKRARIERAHMDMKKYFRSYEE